MKCYGKEPFDLRLTALRLLYKLPMIALATVLGVLVFGGGYYVKNVLLQKEQHFSATSVFRVEYAADSVDDLMRIYINEMTWNTYMQSGLLFLELVQERLDGVAEISDEELSESLEAFVWSDIRVPAITVTLDDSVKCEQVIRAVEAVMVQDFALPEIGSVALVDSGRVEEVFPDVRVGRAVILSAVLSCFFAVVLFLLKETGDDSIWLPNTIWKRYGLKVAGTVESRDLSQNLAYFFRREIDFQGNREAAEPEESGYTGTETVSGKGRFAVCMVQESLKHGEVLEGLRRRCPEIFGGLWYAVESPLTEPAVCNGLREAEGILLAVKAGNHAGKKLEYVLEYLEQQDCKVTAAILWEADEKLIRRYYFPDRCRKANVGQEGAAVSK